MSDTSSRDPLRVALSNDYELVLAGTAALLQGDARVQVVDITTSPKVSESAQVILFDTFGRVPKDDRKLSRMIAENAPTPVVVFSWDAYPEKDALAAGAAGYIHKGITGGELAEALVRIHGRDTTTVSAPADAQPDGSGLAWPGREFGLSERESQILTLITRGLSNQEIVERAYLSINTVKTYIRTCYRKIGVSSRSQAVIWGVRHGFASTDDTGV